MIEDGSAYYYLSTQNIIIENPPEDIKAKLEQIKEDCMNKFAYYIK